MRPRGHVVKAMLLVTRPGDGALLVSEGTSPSGEAFQRPLGGHVELGERTADTVRREIEEEIGQRLTSVRLVEVLENIFDWDGSLQHELVFVFSGEFADASAYGIEEQFIRDSRRPTRVVWRARDAVGPALYPSGIAELWAGGPPASGR